MNKIWILNLWFFIGNEEDYRMNYLNNIKNSPKKQSNYFLQKYYKESKQISLRMEKDIQRNLKLKVHILQKW